MANAHIFLTGGPIDPDDSHLKCTADAVIITLAKKNKGNSWKDVESV
jgi:hypothetical protein